MWNSDAHPTHSHIKHDYPQIWGGLWMFRPNTRIWLSCPHWQSKSCWKQVNVKQFIFPSSLCFLSDIPVCPQNYSHFFPASSLKQSFFFLLPEAIFFLQLNLFHTLFFSGCSQPLQNFPIYFWKFWEHNSVEINRRCFYASKCSLWYRPN